MAQRKIVQKTIIQLTEYVEHVYYICIYHTYNTPVFLHM